MIAVRGQWITSLGAIMYGYAQSKEDD